MEEDGSVASIDDVTLCAGGSMNRTQWSEHMERDAMLKEVMSIVKNGRRRESAVGVDVRPFCKILKELSVPGMDVVLRGDKFIPPLGVRGNLIDLAHHGHLGQTMTKKRVRENF